ncbi:MAG: acyl-ACP desaturase [Myxococcales bacterium]|nr:acyl-ACP desaturase [Myxococcales bacterium]
MDVAPVTRAPLANLEPPRTKSYPPVPEGLYHAFRSGEETLVSMTWRQQQLHEARRWSVVEMLEHIDVDSLSREDRTYVWNAGRAELTTKPGADRVTRLADKECRRWQDTDPALAAVMQACGTWSRYWNEEEAHHETVFNELAARMGMPAVEDSTFIEFRKIFPDDDMLRTLTLLAISEIAAANKYVACSRACSDPGLAALLRQVASDEIQHMRYFSSFARGLVDSGRYHGKEAISIAYLFTREGGELFGSRRERVEERDSHVNWWDHVQTDDGVSQPDSIERQRTMIFAMIKSVTGISVGSVEELEDAWMDAVGC